MKKYGKKLLALLLAMVMCVSLLPVAAFADEGEAAEQVELPVVEQEEPAEEPETPAEEPEAPAEEPEAPAEEPETPAEEPEAPAEEPETPAEEPEAPAEEPEAPAEEPEAPAEEPETPADPEAPVDPEAPAEEPEAPVDPEAPVEEIIEACPVEETVQLEWVPTLPAMGLDCGPNGDDTVQMDIDEDGNATVYRNGVTNGNFVWNYIIGAYSNYITTVTFGTGIIGISSYSFQGLSGLTSVTMTDVQTIGEWSFVSCEALASVTLSSSLRSIGANSFRDCGLETITLPSGLEYIKTRAFSQCAGLTVTLPSVEDCYIEGGAFAGCKKVITDTPMRIDGTKLISYFGTASKLTIPGSITEIADYAFSGCSSLTSVTIPNGVTYIGRCAFEDCTNLSVVKLPDTVAFLAYYTFGNCSALKSISLPSSLTDIGQFAFQLSGLQSITLPAGTTSVGAYSFSGAEYLDTVVLPEGVLSIEEGAFDYAVSLSHITLPSSLRTIGDSAFINTFSLSELVIPEGVTAIEAGAFFNNRLRSITLPSTLDSIGENAFAQYSQAYNKLTQLLLPDDVKSVGNNAFLNGPTVFVSCTNKYLRDFSSIHTGFQQTVTRKATCTQTGMMKDFCSSCGWSDEYEKSKLSHNYVNHVCSLCGGHDETSESASGSCGNGIYWEYKENTLYLSGKGAVPAYAAGETPWVAYQNDIYYIQISTGITGIGAGAFSDLNSNACVDINLYSGASFALNPALIPGAAADAKYTWKLTYPEGGKISSKGVFKANTILADGTFYCPIGCYDAATGTQLTTVYFEICPVAVSVGILYQGYEVTGLTIPYNLRAPSSDALSFVTETAPLIGGSVTWTCSDKKGTYCSWTSNNGTLKVCPSDTGKTGTVTFTAVADSSGKKATVKVSFVNAALPGELKITNLPAGSIQGKKSISLKTNLSSIPGITDKNVVWSVSTDAQHIASISKTGKLTVQAVGKTTVVAVTATLASDRSVTDTRYITLRPVSTTKPAEIRITDESIGEIVNNQTVTHNVGDGLSLTIDVFPSKDYEQAWKSSNAKIAEIDKDGNVIIHKAGTVTFTVTIRAMDGTKLTAKVKYSFRVPVETVTIDGGSIFDMAGGKKLKLSCTVNPSDATNKKVTWTILDGGSAFASISSSGVITAKKVTGFTAIRVKVTSVDDPNVWAVCRVNINPA